MNILLVGYYGHGNFGDDVLFLATLNLVRRLWPKASVAVQTEAASPFYLAQLAGFELQFLRMHEHGSFDLAFHGGGGNFFDFAEGRTWDLVINRAAGMLGPRRFAAIVRSLRKLLGRNIIDARQRAAIGLGIGTYTPSARRLRHEMQILASMDFLGVRDPGSIDNLRLIGIAAPVEETSDLAFAGGWGENGFAPSSSGPIVVVVRDWKDQAKNGRQLDALRAVAAIQPVRVWLFDGAADRGLLPLLGDFQVKTYRPGCMHDLIETLSSAPAIVTARAHGAICGAILGVPSLLLPIEPKLAAVNRLLPQSTILANWSDDIQVCLINALSVKQETIAVDVGNNRAVLNRAITLLHNKIDLKPGVKRPSFVNSAHFSA